MNAASANLPRTPKLFATLCAATIAAALLVAGLGYFPTLNLAGQAGVLAMLAAIAIATLATLAGLLPLMFKLHAPPLERHNAALAGMALRLFVAAAVTAAVALSDVVAWRPLVLWVALSYIALLAIDIVALVYVLKRVERNAACPS